MDPRKPWLSRISDANEYPFCRLISVGGFWSPSSRPAASSGSHRDWTMSELPHSLLYSSMMLDSWWLSKNWSGMVWRKYCKILLKIWYLYQCRIKDNANVCVYLKHPSYILDIVHMVVHIQIAPLRLKTRNLGQCFFPLISSICIVMEVPSGWSWHILHYHPT